eukprot:1099208-Amorphochlora_amoeboformis.AAC.1
MSDSARAWRTPRAFLVPRAGRDDLGLDGGENLRPEVLPRTWGLLMGVYLLELLGAKFAALGKKGLR